MTGANIQRSDIAEESADDCSKRTHQSWRDLALSLHSPTQYNMSVTDALFETAASVCPTEIPFATLGTHVYPPLHPLHSNFRLPLSL
jgi:hypothetical protein